MHAPERRIEKASQDLADAQGHLLGGEAEDSGQGDDGEEVDDENGERAHALDEVQGDADGNGDEQPVDGVPAGEEHGADLGAHGHGMVQKEPSVHGLFGTDRGLILVVGPMFFAIGISLCLSCVCIIIILGILGKSLFVVSPDCLAFGGLDRRGRLGIVDYGGWGVFVDIGILWVGGWFPYSVGLPAQGIPAVAGTPGDVARLALELVWAGVSIGRGAGETDALRRYRDVGRWV